METKTDRGAKWLAIVDLGGVEYAVDLEEREFRQLQDKDRAIRFDSEQGLQMTKVILGDRWQLCAGRKLWERK